MRSLLFVPGDSDRKLAKSTGAGADCILIDLEDSVAPAGKAAARGMVAEFLRGHPANERKTPFYVRINDLASGLAEDDLAAVVSACPDGIMLPKAGSAAAIHHVSRLMEPLERESGLAAGTLKMVVLAFETPQGVLNAASFAECDPRVVALTWGGEDMAAALGAKANKDGGDWTPPMELARSLCLHAAAAAEVAAIDTVFVDFRDPEGLARECARASRDGFAGKLAIHPDQVVIINRSFSPSPEEIDLANKIVSAFEAQPDAGVLNIEGRMFDQPHLKKARRTLQRAKAVRP